MKYAYVALLYGNSEYFLGALVFGYSLLKTKPHHDVILLVTPDIPQKQRDILKDYFIIKEIDYIRINTKNFLIKNNRFTDVFTKLHLYNLTEYDKVMLFDIDYFALKNMDHLFDLETPAAHFRNIKLPHGKKVPKGLITIDKNRIKGGVNAGLMLLKPNKNEFNDIIEDINSDLSYKLKSPEQDYLSYRYKDNWTHIDFAYGCKFDIQKQMSMYNYSIHDLYGLQYAWILKPWELVLDNKVKVFNVLKKLGKDITYFTLWVHHYRILKRIYKEKNVDLSSLYDRRNDFKDRIDKL